jgi:transposase
MKKEKVCIIMDNAKIHRKKDLESITIEFGFCFKFLSPYSYMVNPIENAFSKIKLGVRSKLRSSVVSGDLEDIILKEASKINSSDCSGYFRYMMHNIAKCSAGLPYRHQ